MGTTVEMAKRDRYGYLEGLALLAKRLNDKDLSLDIIDHDEYGMAHCEQCGAAIRYEYRFWADRFSKGVGVCCAQWLEEYLGLPENLLKLVISFFKRYRRLAENANIKPQARMGLLELESQIAKHTDTRKANAKRAREYSELVEELLGWGKLNEVEQSIVTKSRRFISPRMLNVLMRKGRGEGGR